MVMESFIFMIWKAILYFHLMITKIKSLDWIHQIVLIVPNYASTLCSEKREEEKGNKPQGKGLHCCVWVKTKGRGRRKSLKSLCCLGVFSLIAWLSKYMLYPTTFWGIKPKSNQGKWFRHIRTKTKQNPSWDSWKWNKLEPFFGEC